MSGCPSGGGLNTYRLACIQTVGGSAQGTYDIGDGVDVECTADTNAGFNICVLNGKSISHGKFYPLFKYAEDSATVLTPFAKTNIQLTQDKVDNSVIGTVENGTNPTKSYAVGEHMIRGGKFCTVTVAVTTSSTWTLGSNYVEGDVADELNPSESSITTAETMSDGYNSLYKWGKMVQANLRFKTVTGGTDDLLGTIPSGYRPVKTMFIMAKASISGSIWLEINSYGNISLKSSVSSENIQLHTVWMTA